MRLLMLSGGLDSTYLAWKLVQEEEPIHFHHISIRNDVELMWKPQYNSVRNSIKFLEDQNYSFTYSFSRFDFHGFHKLGFDSDLIMLVAQKVAQNFDVRFKTIDVIMGWASSDLLRPIIAKRVRDCISENIWTALVNSIEVRKGINPKMQHPLIDRNISKTDMLREMPSELINITWTCRTPKIDGSPCGVCHACKDLKKAKDLV